MSAINHSQRWLSIVGIGEDGLAGLSPIAAAVVAQAELLVGGARHLAMVSAGSAERLAWPPLLSGAIAEIEAARGRRVVVLASGDPFLWGVGVTLARSIPAEEIACYPAPSSFALAAARLGWAQQDCALISLHGRPLETLVPHVQPGARILALSWDGKTPARAAERLTAMGFGPSRLIVLERMGGPNEVIRTARADTFDLRDVDPLNVLAIEAMPGLEARPLPLTAGLPDEFFENDGQLTKREIRAVTLSALHPLKGELLWDIGLGAGSIAIEWLLRHPANRAIGIEENAERGARAIVNAVNLGTPHLRIVHGAAPAALEGLEAPDAVFIGGGVGDEAVFSAAWAALKPGGRLVANAITLESEQRLAQYFARHGGSLIRVSVERLVPVGSMHGWRPAMPVTQWSVVKP
ncbi:precorrin-6Y methyltransferase [Labrys miyagiensis]|uniref:Precorrin-6Y methyltransferase n=1 Tax=Labrys miyagiensis TaxID=346912 RepID=A0ABQ6CF89_9HYPH|nr:precorrin-6y C5,15-methyltransferase (decarboxylating) subunit CbiE [Labrys miyagiensis]GLS18338.1 precorrin-6Y methyltransferase [Labrys miyagiensis]